MSPPVPPLSVSSPWPPKITSPSVDAWALTVSSSLENACGTVNVCVVVLTTRTTTSAPVGAPAKCSVVPLTVGVAATPLTVAKTWSPAASPVNVTSPLAASVKARTVERAIWTATIAAVGGLTCRSTVPSAWWTVNWPAASGAPSTVTLTASAGA